MPALDFVSRWWLLFWNQCRFHPFFASVVLSRKTTSTDHKSGMDAKHYTWKLCFVGMTDFVSRGKQSSHRRYVQYIRISCWDRREALFHILTTFLNRKLTKLGHRSVYWNSFFFNHSIQTGSETTRLDDLFLSSTTWLTRTKSVPLKTKNNDETQE